MNLKYFPTVHPVSSRNYLQSDSITYLRLKLKLFLVPLHLLELMNERQNICKTIHLPAQSGSTSCLERMRRGYTRQAYIDLVHKIKEIVPNIAFTSDFISGFCGETEEEHEDTISLMKNVKYNFCFMYPFSMREKTKGIFHKLFHYFSI